MADGTDEAAWARRLARMLDLTNLDDGCDPAAIDALCAAAVAEPGPVAAVCVWPSFVAQAREALAGSNVLVATVANFPAGDGAAHAAAEACVAAADDGAHEVDVVAPWRSALAGDSAGVAALVAACRAALPKSVALKVILESGAFEDLGALRSAADAAIGSGADFLKTSTGKHGVGATRDAADVLIAGAAATATCGVKVSGGVRTFEDARAYAAAADAAFGPVDAGRFRIGASGLLTALRDKAKA